MNQDELEYCNLTIHEVDDDEYYATSLINRYQDRGLNMDDQDEAFYD